jgi:hypothetical protein
MQSHFGGSLVQIARRGRLDYGDVLAAPVLGATKDLPTKYAKVVVTDDQGRFVMAMRSGSI